MAKEPKDKKDEQKKVTRIAGMEGGSRIKDMSATAEIGDQPEVAGPEEKATDKPVKKAKVRGQAYHQAKALVDKSVAYSIKDAIELLKKSSLTKFVGTVEIHLTVSQKGLSGEVTLPHFQGKVKKIIVFDDKLPEQLKEGKIDFDVLLCRPADMPKLLPFAKLLGPKGLMPNPKNNTVVADPQKAAKSFSTTALSYKTEKDFPLIHSVFGKLDQPAEELIKNFEAFIKAVDPKNIKRVHLKSTMSPSIRVTL